MGCQLSKQYLTGYRWNTIQLPSTLVWVVHSSQHKHFQGEGRLWRGVIYHLMMIMTIMTTTYIDINVHRVHMSVCLLSLTSAVYTAICQERREQKTATRKVFRNEKLKHDHELSNMQHNLQGVNIVQHIALLSAELMSVTVAESTFVKIKILFFGCFFSKENIQK